MLHSLRPVFTAFRATALLVAVLLVLGLNQRAVSVLRLPDAPAGKARYAGAPRATVVRQKVTLEATTSAAHFVAPSSVAWLPLLAGVSVSPWAMLRRALAVLPVRAGVSAGAVFRARLLRAALSPQAP